MCDLSSKSHGKLSAPWWGDRNSANTKSGVRGIGNGHSSSLCKNLYTDRFTWVIITFFCSPWICHWAKKSHAWMFKEIKEKAHDEYFMQMHSFWFCGFVVFLGVCVGFSVPSMRLNNWDWSLNHSLKWVAEVEKRSEKVGGLYVASESLSLWYDSRVKRVFQLNPRTQGVFIVFGDFARKWKRKAILRMLLFASTHWLKGLWVSCKFTKGNVCVSSQENFTSLLT